MAVMDEFKDERDSIKNAPFSKKLSYFWYYNKWKVIIGVVVAIVIFFTIRGYIYKKDDVLYIAMINITPTLDNIDNKVYSEICDPFLEENGYDLKHKEIRWAADYLMNVNNGQTLSDSDKLSIFVATGSIDFFYGSGKWIDTYAYRDVLAPVTWYMSEEEIAEYSDYLYYIDGAVLERYEKAQDEQNYEYSEELPDPLKPEEMVNPIPIGIILDSCKPLQENYDCLDEEPGVMVASAVMNSKNQEVTKEYFKFLLRDNMQ